MKCAAARSSEVMVDPKQAVHAYMEGHGHWNRMRVSASEVKPKHRRKGAQAAGTHRCLCGHLRCAVTGQEASGNPYWWRRAWIDMRPKGSVRILFLYGKIRTWP
ncbi:hypothetical protein NDU88_006823 [Pleurodeles waltl]|uniref:Uncharacterized protein n=1 Tax=Pleurodeles waltl TaxID=8319 RepID=A0AAV7QM99_PLEWA|nr:hypothetical protein NDU88_006823 [Pleurodeles waltl]